MPKAARSGKSLQVWLARQRSPAARIQGRRPLAARPAAIDHQPPGHWEADLMRFRSDGQAVLTVHERHCRLLLAGRPQARRPPRSPRPSPRCWASCPPPGARTSPFDNGTEFARHHELQALVLETFCCDTQAPWPQGGIGNANERLRRGLPRKTDLATVADTRFTEVVQLPNNTPRECLDYRTPTEIFWREVLHFKGESTFPRAPE